MVVICISLMTDDVKDLPISRWAICISLKNAFLRSEILAITIKSVLLYPHLFMIES